MKMDKQEYLTSHGQSICRILNCLTQSFSQLPSLSHAWIHRPRVIELWSIHLFHSLLSCKSWKHIFWDRLINSSKVGLRVPSLFVFWWKYGQEWSFGHFVIHRINLTLTNSIWAIVTAIWAICFTWTNLIYTFNGYLVLQYLEDIINKLEFLRSMQIVSSLKQSLQQLVSSGAHFETHSDVPIAQSALHASFRLGTLRERFDYFFNMQYTYGQVDGSMKFSIRHVIRPNIGSNFKNLIFKNRFILHNENFPLISVPYWKFT